VQKSIGDSGAGSFIPSKSKGNSKNGLSMCVRYSLKSDGVYRGGGLVKAGELGSF